ncbi:MAG: peptide-methionine (S)-S-oxide reductase [Halovenus sp.]
MTLTPTVLREYDRSAPDRTETRKATVGLGCFWGPDAAFGALDGVIRTSVGYAGGTKLDPSYRTLGDHTEVVRLEYDPTTTRYRDILEMAFAEHSPERQARNRQYHNVVLVESDKQAETLDAFLDSRGLDADSIETRLERLDEFYLAEPYHQKYNLKSTQWMMTAFDEAGYDATEIRRSPAGAKLNAHVSGHDVSLPFLDARSRGQP